VLWIIPLIKQHLYQRLTRTGLQCHVCLSTRYAHGGASIQHGNQLQPVDNPGEEIFVPGMLDSTRL